MTIYIYSAEEVANGTITESIDSFDGADNAECEAWAEDNYGDCEVYVWSYCEN